MRGFTFQVSKQGVTKVVLLYEIPKKYMEAYPFALTRKAPKKKKKEKEDKITSASAHVSSKLYHIETSRTRVI